MYGDESAGTYFALNERPMYAESAGGLRTTEKHIGVIHKVQSCGTFPFSPPTGTFGVSQSGFLQNVPH